jgi:YbbR domain-containing protein
MRRWFPDIGSAVLAVVLALIVWANAEQESSPVFVIRGVPIAIRNLGPGLQIKERSAEVTDVHGRAPSTFWEAGAETEFEAFVDLTGIDEGSHSIALQVASPAREVQILEVTPASIEMELERVISKMVPVRAELMDSPSTGYDPGSPSVEPSEIEVSGAQRYVDRVQEAVAEVYLRNARSTVERRLGVSLRDDAGLPVDPSIDWDPLLVTVTVPVEQRPGYRDVSVRVRWEGQPERGYRINEVAVDPSIITLFGSPEAIDSVPGYVETSLITIEGASSSVVERLALIVPENVSVSGAQSVVVSVGITAIEESAWVQRSPVIQGLSSRFVVELSPDMVEILLVGPLRRLEALQPGDVQLILNLTDLEAGTHGLAPELVLPEGIRQQTLVPETIEVKIAERPISTPTMAPTSTSTPTSSATPSATPTASPTAETTADSVIAAPSGGSGG